MATVPRPSPFFNAFPLYLIPFSDASNHFFQFSPDSPFLLQPFQVFPRATFPRSSSHRILKNHRLVRCLRCGGEGHTASYCFLSVRCFLCGASGHKRLSCRRFKAPKPASKARGSDFSKISAAKHVTSKMWTPLC